MIDEGDQVDGEDIDIEEDPSSTDDPIDLVVACGPLTGVRIATQGQIRRRTRRWRRKATAPTTASQQDVDMTARDAVSYAVLRTLEMQRVGDLVVRDPRTASLTTEAIGDTIFTHELNPGFATRMKKGSMYGRRYAAAFREELYELFYQGERRKSDKLGPGRMLEILQQKHPDRYDLPSENEIRQEIAKFRMSGKPRGLSSSLQTTPAEQSGMRPRDADQFIASLLTNDPDLKPQKALSLYRSTFGQDSLSDSQLKAKFSGLKTRRKKLQLH